MGGRLLARSAQKSSFKGRSIKKNNKETGRSNPGLEKPVVWEKK